MTRGGQALTTAEEFREFVKGVIADSPDPSPTVIAEKITGQLTAAECRIALRLCLPDYVKARQSHQTFVAMRNIRKGAAASSVPSAKVAIMRNWATERAAFEASALFNGTDHLRIGDATADDLIASAAYKRGKAQETLARADELDRLAQVMAETGAYTVHDLADEALRGWLDASKKAS